MRAIAKRGARAGAPGIITWLALIAATVTAETAVLGMALAQGGPSAPAAQDNPLPPAAQDNPLPPATTDGRMQAPIGHRQPRPSDLPPDVQREEHGLGRSPVDRGLDQMMQICRDC
jgi:hypothetical protein